MAAPNNNNNNANKKAAPKAQQPAPAAAAPKVDKPKTPSWRLCSPEELSRIARVDVGSELWNFLWNLRNHPLTSACDFHKLSVMLLCVYRRNVPAPALLTRKWLDRTRDLCTNTKEIYVK